MRYVAMVKHSDGWSPATPTLFSSRAESFRHLALFWGDKPATSVGTVPVRRKGRGPMTCDPADPDFMLGSQWDRWEEQSLLWRMPESFTLALLMELRDD